MYRTLLQATALSGKRNRVQMTTGSVYLMYHDVFINKPHPALPRTAALYHISRKNFAWHLLAILGSGHPVLTVGETLDTPGERSVALTFDDGWRGTFACALPLLRQLGWHATIFVTRDAVGRPGFCTPEMILAAAESGTEIGIHGTTHRMLTECSPAEIIWEFRTCRSYLESITGKPVEIASVPGGAVNNTVTSCAAEVGIRALCTSRPGINSPATPVMDLRRMAVHGTTSSREIRRYCRFRVNRETGRWLLREAATHVLGSSKYAALRRRFLNRQMPVGGSTEWIFGPHSRQQ